MLRSNGLFLSRSPTSFAFALRRAASMTACFCAASALSAARRASLACWAGVRTFPSQPRFAFFFCFGSGGRTGSGGVAGRWTHGVPHFSPAAVVWIVIEPRHTVCCSWQRGQLACGNDIRGSLAIVSKPYCDCSWAWSVRRLPLRGGKSKRAGIGHFERCSEIPGARI
jgi:hypothetical protein